MKSTASTGAWRNDPVFLDPLSELSVGSFGSLTTENHFKSTITVLVVDWNGTTPVKFLAVRRRGNGIPPKLNTFITGLVGRHHANRPQSPILSSQNRGNALARTGQPFRRSQDASSNFTTSQNLLPMIDIMCLLAVSPTPDTLLLTFQEKKLLIKHDPSSPACKIQDTFTNNIQTDSNIFHQTNGRSGRLITSVAANVFLLFSCRALYIISPYETLPAKFIFQNFPPAGLRDSPHQLRMLRIRRRRRMLRMLRHADGLQWWQATGSRGR